MFAKCIELIDSPMVMSPKAGDLYRHGMALFNENRCAEAFGILSRLSLDDLDMALIYEHTYVPQELVFPALAESARRVGNIEQAQYYCNLGIQNACTYADASLIIVRIKIIQGAIWSMEKKYQKARGSLDQGMREMMSWKIMNKSEILKLWAKDTYIPAMRAALQKIELTNTLVDELLLYSLIANALQGRYPRRLQKLVDAIPAASAQATHNLWDQFGFLFGKEKRFFPFPIIFSKKP